MNHRRYTYFTGEDILLLKRRYTSFLKETHRSLMRSGMGALLLILLLLTACVGEELQKPLLGEGEGYLRLQIGAISAEIQTAPLTKTTTPLDASLVPDEGNLTINIKNTNTQESVFTGSPTGESMTFTLKTGIYIVEAFHGENGDIQTTPYFFGSDTVEVKKLQTASTTIDVKLANAMLIPVVTDSLKRHYKEDWTLTASVGKTIFPLASATKGIDTLYAKAGETAFTFSGTNLAEKKVSSTWKETFAAGYAYQLQCNPNIDAFKSIKVKATAEHTYDKDNRYLTGTNIKSFSADWNGADSAAIASWQVNVWYRENIIRTYTGSSLSNMTYTDTGWPYIPQGSTLSASVTLKSKDKISDLKGTFTSLPAPDFGVSVSAQTSYSVYTTSGAAAANEKNGSSIFDITSSVSISEEILRKYPELLSAVTYSENVDNATTSAALNTSASLTNLSWACHQLTAGVTFDETTKTTSKPYACDVTGLPYKPSNMIEADWKFASLNNKYKDGMIQLGGIAGSGECTATSKMTFHIPEDIHIRINTNVSVRDFYYKGVLLQTWRETTFTVSINDSVIISQSGNHEDNNDTGKNYNLTGIGTFNSNETSIKLNSSYKLAGPWSKVYIFHVLYN